jgi:probable HAF family extracellular repeat protein
MGRITILTSLVALILSCCPGVLGDLYQVTDLGTLGGTYSLAFGINSSGQVVGSATIAGDAVQYAFIYSNGQMTSLGALGGNYGIATAINNIGQVVGLAGPVAGGQYQAVLYSQGQMSAIAGPNAEAFGINDTGAIVGDFQNSPSTTHAFLYQNGTFTDLDPSGVGSSRASGINNAGQIVGYYSVGGFRTSAYSVINYSTDSIGSLGGGTSAEAINALGQVVGTSQLPHGQGPDAFRTAPNGVINPFTDDLGTLNGGSTNAIAINNSGEVVGSSSDRDGHQTAFVFTGGQIYDLSTLMMAGSDFTHLQFALGINDSGQIVGEGFTSSGEYHAFLATPVPEPSTLTICASAILIAFSKSILSAALSFQPEKSRE